MHSQQVLIYVHLATVLPAMAIGTYLMLNSKGTPTHRQLGKWYMSLLVFTSVVSLFLKAQIGPRLFDHFGYIHLIAFVTLYSVPMAYYTARKHNVKRHKRLMALTYAGAVVIAGIAAVVQPGRVLHSFLFG